MSTTDEELGGFEGRLLTALTELDGQRPAMGPPPVPRKAPWRRPAVIVGGSVAIVLVGAATATATAGLLDRHSFLDVAGGRVVAGGAVTLKGGGCGGGVPVAVSLDGTEIERTVASADGDFYASVAVPASTALGRHTVTAHCKDGSASGLSQSATVEVVPKSGPPPPALNVMPDAFPGRPLVVKGTGCRPGAVVTLRFDGRDLDKATAAPDGLYYATPTIPPGTALGSHELEARCTGQDGSDLRLSERVRVVEPPSPAGPTLAIPAAARPGGEIAAKGSGCQPATAVTFSLDGSLLPQTTTADTGGAFYLLLQVPGGTALGSHKVQATCTGADGRELRLMADLSVVLR